MIIIIIIIYLHVVGTGSSKPNAEMLQISSLSSPNAQSSLIPDTIDTKHQGRPWEAASTMLCDRLHVMGDTCYGSIPHWVFDGFNWSWLPSPLQSRRAACMVAIESQRSLYLMGGAGHSRAAPPAYSTMERFDLSTLTWTLIKQCLPIGVYGASAIVWQDTIMVIGGIFDTRAPPVAQPIQPNTAHAPEYITTYHDIVQVYSLTTEKWSFANWKLVRPLAYFSARLVDSTLIIVGGVTINGHVTNEAWSVNLMGGILTIPQPLPPLPIKVRGMASVVI
jgi:hypothetical protein